MKEVHTIQYKFGKAVKQLRLKKELSQMNFCKESGIDLKYLSNIENGRRNPSIDIIQRVAKTLGMKVSDMMKVMEEIK